jgi:hypothetical protein
MSGQNNKPTITIDAPASTIATARRENLDIEVPP